MTCDLDKFYKKCDIDSGEVLDRLMGNEAIYIKCLECFLKDECVGLMEEGYALKDRNMIFQNAHALKGVASNLGFKNLERMLVRISDIYRAGDMQAEKKDLDNVRSEYDKTCKYIKKYVVM